jgi:predicted NBD/HSP70 family sugar kinase
MSEACFLGIDLGGTQLRMAAVSGDGQLLSEMLTVPTGRGFGPAQLEAEVRQLQERLVAGLRSRPGAGLGFGTAGGVRPGPQTQCSHHPPLPA